MNIREVSEKSLNRTLSGIQAELKAPKGQFNQFGKYKYRSCEDILEAVKPLLAKKNVVLTITDDMILLGNRYYVKATVTLSNDLAEGSNCIQSTAFAREAETKKGMDASQITGAASSYARKYALNGLLLIDDNKDADTQDKTKPESKPAYKNPELVQPPQPEQKQAQEPDKNIISEKQVKFFFAKGKENGWAVEELKELIKTFGYEHTKNIQRKDFSKIIELLEKGVPGLPADEKTQEERIADMEQSTQENVNNWESKE